MAEIIGKVFDKATAEEYYGPVVKSTEISTEKLKEILSKCDEEILIRLNDEVIEILDQNRKPVYPSDLEISKDDVFHRFSTQVVTEFLAKGSSSVVNVEQRYSVLTATSGSYLLEASRPCPPFC